MTVQVYTGKDPSVQLRQLEHRLLRTGRARRTIFLNGGSESRRDEREYWQEWAATWGLRFEAIGGYMVVIGGPG